MNASRIQGLENRCEQADLTAPGHLRPCRKDGRYTRSIRETHGLGKRDKQEKARQEGAYEALRQRSSFLSRQQPGSVDGANVTSVSRPVSPGDNSREPSREVGGRGTGPGGCPPRWAQAGVHGHQPLQGDFGRCKDGVGGGEAELAMGPERFPGHRHCLQVTQGRI